MEANVTDTSDQVLGKYPCSIFTPESVVRKMLEIAEIKSNEVVYDLGSGNGTTLLVAAKAFGANAVGIEKEEDLFELSKKRVSEG